MPASALDGSWFSAVGVKGASAAFWSAFCWFWKYAYPKIATANSTTTIVPAISPQGGALRRTTVGFVVRVVLLLLPLTMNRPECAYTGRHPDGACGERV